MQSKITKIMAQKRKGRFNIFIDGHYAFPVSENVLIRFQLVKGMEIDQQLETQLVAADQIDKIYQKAINYLSGQLRTEHEVKTKLQQSTEDPVVIDAVIQRLKANWLLNDQNYADSYVRSEVRIQDKGPVAIRQHLKQKGISEAKIEQALTQYYGDTDLLENGLHQAQKMFKRYHNDSFQQTLNKLKQGLVRKGYSFDTINLVLQRADFQPDLEQEDAILRRQFERTWHRYRTLDDQQRQFKTKQALYRKGFQIDAINQLIENASI